MELSLSCWVVVELLWSCYRVVVELLCLLSQKMFAKNSFSEVIKKLV